MSHFSKEQIEEIRRRLVKKTVKDSEFDTASEINLIDSVAIVQNNFNKKISIEALRHRMLEDPSWLEGVTASVDANTGIPYVEVQYGGSGISKTFDFSFHNLKGEIGADGEQGPQGPAGADGKDGKDGKDGSDADVTAENIAAALGYTPADASDVPTAQQQAAWDAKYTKPSGGIPSADMTEGVQQSLGRADSAYQKPGSGIPGTDLESAVQTSLGKADTAYQKPSGGIPKTDLASGVQESLGKADASATQSEMDSVTAKIPSQASAQNQLADKGFVNSSIATATATHRGTYNLVTDLSLSVSATEQQIAAAIATKLASLSITADNNDYVFVQIPTADETPSEIERVDRYKYNGTAWGFEFSLNNSGFTAAQWAAINSGITDALVSAFNAKYDKPSGGIPKSDMDAGVQSSLDKADSALQEHQDISGKANKSEMSVTDGTGADADKTTIQLKSGTIATVLKSHQDISGKEDSSNKVTVLSASSTDTQYPSAKTVYDALYENVLISLGVNSAGTASDLIGLKVTVTNADTSEQISEQTWQGTPLVVRIKAGVRYTVSVQTHQDYVTPASQTFTSELASTRSVGFIYAYSAVIDLSYRDTDGTKKMVQDTANSYVARVAGDYKLPAVYGNAIKNGATNSAAYTRQGSTYTADFVNYKGVQITSPYIETDTGETIASAVLLWQTGANLISNVAFANGYVTFTVNSIPTENGLAVLAVKDGNGDIMWSWTIWLTTDTLTAEKFTNYTEVDYYLMPENIFCIWNEQRTNYGTGMIQWGRKDVMVPNTPGSSPQMTVYDIDGNTITPGTSLGSVIGVFGTDNDQNADKTVANSIKNPGMFFTRYDSTNNNWNNLAWFNNFWNAAETSSASSADNQDTAIKTIYDPCPFGWMLPAGRALTGFTTTGGGTSTASQFNVVGSWSNGWNFKRNPEDTAGNKFVASGYRASGSGAFTGVGSLGGYWSFAPDSQAYARSLYFGSGFVYPQDYNRRSSGFAVRPSRESE